MIAGKEKPPPAVKPQEPANTQRPAIQPLTELRCTMPAPPSLWLRLRAFLRL